MLLRQSILQTVGPLYEQGDPVSEEGSVALASEKITRL